MKKQHEILFGLAMIAGVLLTGCKDSAGPGDDEQAPAGVTNEMDAMKYFALQDEFVKNTEETISDDNLYPADYGTFGKVAAEITPLRFGRFITSVTRTATPTILPGDSIAIVFVEKEIMGVFKIRGLNGVGDTVTIEKPFTDNSTRNLVFKRVERNPRMYWRNWVPVATSLVDGGTVAPNDNIDITMVQLFLPNGDTITVTDPNSYYLRYRWLHMYDGGRKDVPEFSPNQRAILQATVVSTSADTDFVALRYGVGTFQKRRMRLTLVSEVNNGDGTYTRVYQTRDSGMPGFVIHPHRGWFHAAVDAMTRETLYDDAAPYSVNWWGIPYRVF